MDDKAKVANALIDGWESGAFVARNQTSKFTGGALSGRTVANEESRGNKVPGRVRIGRNIAYPVKDYAWWIASRMLKSA